MLERRGDGSTEGSCWRLGGLHSNLTLVLCCVVQEMQSQFLQGRDAEVDYRAIDANGELDNDWIEQAGRDAQERWAGAVAAGAGMHKRGGQGRYQQGQGCTREVGRGSDSV